MARLGQKPVVVPQGVKVETNESTITVNGPKGSLTKDYPKREVSFETKEGELFIKKSKETKMSLAMQGTMRAHLLNMIKGVTQGWEKKLEISGAGYRAEVRGNELVLNVGYSHPVSISLPQGTQAKVEKSTITVEGTDKEVIGQLAANIRNVRKVNPYTGTGIKYIDEVIKRKAGKQAAKAGA